MIKFLFECYVNNKGIYSKSSNELYREYHQRDVNMTPIHLKIKVIPSNY